MDTIKKTLGKLYFKFSWYALPLYFMLIWIVLLKISTIAVFLPWIALGLMALHFTEGCCNAINYILPRRSIENITGKAVFITGCDSGLGLELAIELHKLGFKVFAACLSLVSEGALKLKNETSDDPDRLTLMTLDVTSDEQVDQAYHTVKNNLSNNEYLWAIVNNAGIGAITEVEWCPLQLYHRVMDVNSLGPIRVTKTFLPLLRQSVNGARIVIVTSLAGRYTLPGFSAYSMSKHAAVSFADALRLEMNKWNISVHTIEPTLYRTKIADITMTEKNIDKSWDQCSKEVQESYGKEYLTDFKTAICHHLNEAKPLEMITEVVQDMVDAVAGANPKIRYVPGVVTQLRSRLLSSLPWGVRDSLFLQNQPKTPPADIIKKRLLPPYKCPKIKRTAKRTISEPSREKAELTPPTPTNRFIFPDPSNNEYSKIIEDNEEKPMLKEF